MSQSQSQYIPGMRIELRDAEWRIQRVDRVSDGGYLLACNGLSELVRGRSAQFLTRLERRVRVLDPVETVLVDDLSSGYGVAQLYIDTALRQTPPVDDRIHLGHRAAMDVLPFQLDPARQALVQPRQRMLIADAVGLGKTLEVGILVTELIRRGRGRRILVLATKSMLGQFQQEFWQRFTIPLVRLDSLGLQRVRNQIPTNHNPFHYFDRAIISIDTLKQTLEYRHYLEQAYWDIIIIDEAHNVAKRAGRSQRHRLAELLSTRSDTLIMLSATPHDGKPESFASLVNMLDPTAIANPSDYQHEDFRDKGLVIRRFKQDVAGQLSQQFPEREIGLERAAATEVEEHAFEQLSGVSFATLDGRRQGGAHLFRTTLEKALFSSPAACLATLANRLKRLEKKADDPAVAADIDTLEGLRLTLEAVTPAQFSKYRLLLDLLRPGTDQSLGWQSDDPEDRLVIFTESLETLAFLEERLSRDLKLKAGQLQVLKGQGMTDRELMAVVADFGRRESKIRLLLCSDVASEGINLHHLSHRMIHFDIPWSLMVFQQRNGRIDRYGQTRRPQIRYLMTESRVPKVRGDQRILEVLVDKDEQAGRNIGDPSEFLGVFNQEEEEAKVAAAMEQDKDPNDLSDIFAELFADTAQQAEAGIEAFVPPDRGPTTRSDLARVTCDGQGLFRDDLAYARTALNWLKESGEPVTFTVEQEQRLLDLTAPADLRQRLKFLPREARPEHDRFILTTDKDRVQQSIKDRRDGSDGLFGELHYLWPHHPVMEWLHDRIGDAFGRHTAPVVRLPTKLAADEHWFIVQGGFPNRRGQALIQDTLAVQVRGGEVAELCPAPQLLEALGLDGSPVANPAMAGDCEGLQKLLKPVVERVRRQLRRHRDDVEAPRRARLKAHLQSLDELRGRHLQQLELELEGSDQAPAIKDRRKQEREHQIQRVFDEYRQWLEETQDTEPEPYIQVVAVLTGMEAGGKA